MFKYFSSGKASDMLQLVSQNGTSLGTLRPKQYQGREKEDLAFLLHLEFKDLEHLGSVHTLSAAGKE